VIRAILRPALLGFGVLLPGLAVAAPCAATMPVAGEVSSGFGARHGGAHAGLDLRAPLGTAVRAAAGGTVVFAGSWYAYGLMLEIEHPDGTRARYGHLARFASDARPGARVFSGQVVATLGRTGRTTGPNLHVELRRAGRPVDPLPWLRRQDCAAPELAADPG
jgi:murein DD-endopeptidase MepM/ murein hydrolase activator NlpD